MPKLTATQIARQPERNSQWYVNSDTIHKAFDDLYNSIGRYPTIKEICESTGLSRNTVSDHMNDLRTADYSEAHRMRTTKVIDKAYTMAEAGDVPAMNLIFKYIVPNEAKEDSTGGSQVVNVQLNFVNKNYNPVENAEVVTEENE